MPRRLLPPAPLIAVFGFLVTGLIALFSAGLGFARILHPIVYPPQLFWVGGYIGPAVLLLASVASLVSLRRTPASALLAGTALYMSAYFAAEAFGLSRLPYVSLTMMLVYGLAMVLGGIWWRRERRTAAAV